ncbi:hypothetical protein LINGRAHAP2_LOCUS23081 [Linum grandiflorum]
MVSRGTSSHFIFTDKAQLVWLEGVLTMAAKKRWVLPSICEFRSQRRTLAVTQFHLQGRWVLKIYERCHNQKIFFVIILCDANSHGWF